MILAFFAALLGAAVLAGLSLPAARASAARPSISLRRGETPAASHE